LRLGITQAVGGGYQALHYTLSMPACLMFAWHVVEDMLFAFGHQLRCAWVQQ
jgi:hypothetical protein